MLHKPHQIRVIPADQRSLVELEETLNVHRRSQNVSLHRPIRKKSQRENLITDSEFEEDLLQPRSTTRKIEDILSRENLETQTVYTGVSEQTINEEPVKLLKKETVKIQNLNFVQPFAYDLANKFNERASLEDSPSSYHKNNKISKSGIKQQSSLSWRPFRKLEKVKINAISPELFGAADELTNNKVKEISRQRAKRNWAKARYLFNMARVAGALNFVMDERDLKISRGKTKEQLQMEEEAQNWLNLLNRCYISPQSKVYKIWKSLFQIITVCYIFLLPFVLAFQIENSTLILALDIIDVFYLFDIILVFFVALKNPITGDLILNKKTIALDYLKGTFIADVIALIPYDLFHEKLEALKLIRIVRLTLILDFFNHIITKMISMIIGHNKTLKISNFISSFVSLVLILIVICHFGTCLWIGIGYPNNFEEDTWLGTDKSTKGSLSQGILDSSTLTIFICALNHIVQTLTTVGYGNSVGFTTREQLVSMVVELFGIMLFAYFMQQIKYSFLELKDAELLQKRKIEEIECWLAGIERIAFESRGITNQKLLQNIKKIVKYVNINNWVQLFADNALVKGLPPEEKLQVLKSSFRHIIDKFSIFFNLITDKFQVELLIKAELRLFEDEIIIQRGKDISGVYFILEGDVLLLGGSEGRLFRKLGPGSFFGELSLASDKCSTISYMANGITKCILIKKDVFDEVGKKYPSSMKKLKKLAFLRHQYFLYIKKNIKKRDGVENFEIYFNNFSWKSSLNSNKNYEASSAQTPNFFSNHQGDFSPKRLIFNNLQTIESAGPNFVLEKHQSRKKHSTILQAGIEEKLVKLDDSDVDSMDSENESENEDRESSSNASEGSELDYSDVCPLESFDLNFDDPTKSDQILSYLQGRIYYCEKKLQHLQRRANIMIEGISNSFMRKIKDNFEVCTLADQEGLS